LQWGKLDIIFKNSYFLSYFVTVQHSWPPETLIDGKRTALWLKESIQKGQEKRFDNFERFVVANIGSCEE
jgi:hypothetical protein